MTGKTPDNFSTLTLAGMTGCGNAGLDVQKLGMFLGIANSSINTMTFHILLESGIPIQAGTVQRMTEPEKQTDANKERMAVYTDKVSKQFKEGRLSMNGDKPKLED